MPETRKPGGTLPAWRAATPEDESFLRALHTATQTDFEGLPERDVLLDLQYRARADGYAARHPGACRLILLGDAGPVGMVMLAEEEDATLVVDLAVLPAWQGRGVASAALRTVQATCGSGGVRLHVRADSPARRLYRRLGFREVGSDALNVAMHWTP